MWASARLPIWITGVLRSRFRGQHIRRKWPLKRHSSQEEGTCHSTWGGVVTPGSIRAGQEAEGRENLGRNFHYGFHGNKWGRVADLGSASLDHFSGIWSIGALPYYLISDSGESPDWIMAPRKWLGYGSGGGGLLQKCAWCLQMGILFRNHSGIS